MNIHGYKCCNMLMTKSNLHGLKKQHAREGNHIAHIGVHYLGPLYTRAKSHDHEIVRAQKKVCKGQTHLQKHVLCTGGGCTFT